MANADKIESTEAAWSSGALGADDASAILSTRQHNEIDDALDLQLISVRLPKALIDDLKFIAENEGLKYQPLMRRVLLRFADCEMKRIARDLYAEKQDQRHQRRAA